MNAKDIKLVEFFDEHYYKLTDPKTKEIVYYPSVTTKLQAAPKPFLARWRGDIGNAEANRRLFEAGEKGKRIHFACTLILDGGAVLFNPYNRPQYSPEHIKEIQSEFDRPLFILEDQDEMWQVAKFREWLTRTKAVCVEKDLMVYDDDFEEAGTLDFVFQIEAGEYDINGMKKLELDGGLYVVDLKTGNIISDDYWMQVAAYDKMYGAPTEGGMIIHTNADTTRGIPGLKTMFRTPKELKRDYNDFRAVAQIWERTNKDARPRLLEFPSLITMKEIKVEA